MTDPETTKHLVNSLYRLTLFTLVTGIVLIWAAVFYAYRSEMATAMWFLNAGLAWMRALLGAIVIIGLWEGLLRAYEWRNRHVG